MVQEVDIRPPVDGRERHESRPRLRAERLDGFPDVPRLERDVGPPRARIGAREPRPRDSPLQEPPYNLNADVLNTGFTSPQYLSDYYVKSGSFLRMDNITLGYAFKYRGESMRLFGTVQNAFTITGYKGVDPTAGLNGIDNNIYPRSRTVTGGLSVRF